ncbi:MAG: hypothetical protein AAFU03_05210 [Bacteroidota bacterium]
MKIRIEQAIAVDRNGESLKGVVIEDLRDTQVKVSDALALSEQGIVIPEQNLLHDDNDITYDPDFDDVKWSEVPLRACWDFCFLTTKQLRTCRH